MAKQAKTLQEATIEFRAKLLDIEHIVNRIKAINDLFTPYANENSPEASIIADLLSKELDEITKLLVI